jgi:hypothetical protein
VKKNLLLAGSASPMMRGICSPSTQDTALACVPGMKQQKSDALAQKKMIVSLIVSPGACKYLWPTIVDRVTLGTPLLLPASMGYRQ